ncbi:hypothetical protein JYU34_004105 [Plutella xylostella]|uniref:Uncharacterized protein n=2 Tax=Plutella xylostella TaxID=51655 RepID=A0ABQ7QX58_PLUXY|nr:hypothetical protein JYU34_004105 [Plutella xylostella]CAG9122601.1 unnamed protein product [Plutella xylostella]
MFVTKCLLAASLLVCVVAHVKRDADTKSTSSPLILDLNQFKNHMDEFRGCVDKHLANVVNGVQENQLQPVLSVIGDQVNRLAKAWDVLTAPQSTTPTVSEDRK